MWFGRITLDCGKIAKNRSGGPIRNCTAGTKSNIQLQESHVVKLLRLAIEMKLCFWDEPDNHSWRGDSRFKFLFYFTWPIKWFQVKSKVFSKYMLTVLYETFLGNLEKLENSPCRKKVICIENSMIIAERTSTVGL